MSVVSKLRNPALKFFLLIHLPLFPKPTTNFFILYPKTLKLTSVNPAGVHGWASESPCVCVCVCVCVLSLCVCAQSCLTLCSPINCSPPGSSVHGTFQARILQWVAISFSRGSSQPRDRTHTSYASYNGRRVLYQWHHLGNP